MELSPGSFRTFVVGVSYQLGNLVSSASSTIEATIGERFPLPPKGTTKRYEYGKVICIFMAAVYIYVIILTFLGPEALGRNFHADADEDMTAATAEGRVGIHAHRHGANERKSDSDDGLGMEKAREAERREGV